MTRQEAYCVLNLIPGIGPVRVRRLLSVFGAPEAVLAQPASALAKVTGIGAALAEAVADWRQAVDLRGELALANRAGATLLTPEDDAYPEALKAIYDPPLCLYVRGDASVLSRRADSLLAVVGSRRTTRYGEQTAERLCGAAVDAGLVLVSGLARGIDTVAHRVCVEHGGATVAVLGGGLATLYPPENTGLAQAIVDGGGAVISEQPMLMKPDRRTFPMRNRIIAGLSRGVLVIEAGRNSGSLITARQALEQGRTVFAVPGRIDSPQSSGCHMLIKEGAKLVEGLDDVVEELSFLPLFDSAHTPSRPAERDAAAQSREVSETESLILACLDEGDRSLDELLSETELPVSRLLAELLTMELKRLVRQLPGRRFERGPAAG